MTQGNSMKLIFQFFLPILIGNLFQQLYSFVDSMVVGKGIGDVALAAVGNTSSVHFLILGFAMGLTGGLGICISHSFGANDIEKLRKEIAMSVYICLAIGIVITVGSLFWMRRLFVFLQTPEDMMTDTLVYFGTILAGSTVTIFNNFAMTLLRSVGNSKVPLASMFRRWSILCWIFYLYFRLAWACLERRLQRFWRRWFLPFTVWYISGAPQNCFRGKQTGGQMVYFLAHSLEKACR